VLQRPAVLHGLANNTLTVRKLALGLRYRPPNVFSSTKRRELTLEYGPMRKGPGLTHEAIPRVVYEDDGRHYVAWENEARIYYTNKISAMEYKSATYFATMTGAVLKNLLQTAVAYPIKSRRRYQPFSIYSKSTNELMLKSSNDLDFVQALWQHLADVGVELSPLILPSRWQIRLIASDIRRIQTASFDPTKFYSKLYHCLESMASANYSLYYDHPKKLKKSKNRKKGAQSFEDDLHRFRRIEEQPSLLNASSVEIQPTVSPAPTMFQTVPPLEKDNYNDAAENAHKAAEDANNAAEDAQNSGNAEIAADAAKAAAEAAAKAANATQQQAASMSQAALLGGDGSIMVQTIAQCFRNPIYGLASTNTTAEAYVFWDGSYFFQVNLTTPYLQIIPVTTAMPVATHPSSVSDAEYVDYVLALTVLVFSMIGFLLLLQQVMGRSYHVIRPLYKFQRWLFDPMHYKQARTHEGLSIDEDDDWAINAEPADQTMLNFAKNVIPLSMGGIKMIHWKKVDGSESDDVGLAEFHDSDEDEVPLNGLTPSAASESEVELTDLDKSMSSPSGLRNNGDNGIFKRIFRDPDLVDLPGLRSSSKVAMPVSYNPADALGEPVESEETETFKQAP
jgi:hypothetical protein